MDGYLADGSVATAAVDPAAIQALREELPGLERELFALFLQDTPTRLAAMRAGAAARDPNVLQSSAHTLKSSAVTLGATEMARLCLQIERLGQAESVEGAVQLVDALEAAFQRTRQALEPLLVDDDVPPAAGSN